MPFPRSALSLKRLFGARRSKPRPSILLRLEGLEERCTPVVTDLSTLATFATIQAAVNAANPGDIIRADAGTYAENVTINKPLTLQGAQHGVDARTRSGAESIVDGTSNGGKTPFDVTANGVTIDGFSIQGATNANQFGFGILIGAGTSGSTVENNIIQNNIAGISLANNPNGNPTVIRDNLISNNNAAGPISGTGIYTDQLNAGGALANVVIDSNSFLNDQNAGVLIGSTDATKGDSNVTVSNNVFTGDGNAVLLFNTKSGVITGNTISGSLGSQLVIGGGDNGVQITQNFIQNGATRGIRIGDFGGGSTNSNVTINDNSISGNPTAGLEIDSAAGAYTGTLDASNNWWGSPSGPTTPNNPGGTGDKIIDPNNQVNFSPFLISGADSQPNTPGFQPGPNSATVVVVAGTSGNDTLIVDATGPNSGSYRLNGGPVVNFSNVTSFSFNGGAGDDTFIVINEPMAGLFAPAGGVFYDGGTGNNSLTVQGGIAQTETFTFNAFGHGAQRNGSLAIDNGSLPANYTYEGVGSVQDNVLATVNIIFNLPNNGQDNQVDLGPFGFLGQASAQISSRDGGFATTTVNLAPVTTLTLNAIGPVGQTFHVQNIPGGFPVVNGSGASTLNFDATLQGIGNPPSAEPVGTPTGGLTFHSNLELLYTGIATINLSNIQGVDAAVAPDTTDRTTAFAGLSAQERFVQAVYLDELGRAGVKSELDGWVGLFNGAGLTQIQAQATITTGISQSAEGRDLLVKTWYQTFLGRSAVSGEEQGFVNALLAGQTEESVLAGILGSTEFNNHAHALANNFGTADQTFVQGLYRLLLNRFASSGETADGVAALQTAGRPGLASAVLQSQEFRQDQFEGYYNVLLHRPSDAAGLNSWVFSNLDIATVRVDFEANAEFFSNG
jgi:hypothetical protein